MPFKAALQNDHAPYGTLQTAVTFFHLFYFAHLKGITVLWAQEHKNFLVVVQDQPVYWFMVQTSGVSHSAFNTLALMSETRLWFMSQIVRRSSCWTIFAYHIHTVEGFFLEKIRTTIHVSVYCHLLKGKLSTLTCPPAHLIHQHVFIYFVGSSSV